VATDESLSAVTKTITSGFITSLADQKRQTALVAKDGTVAAQTAQLGGLKDTLKEQKAAGASETTLKQTHLEIKASEAHLDALKSVSQKIVRDATAVQNAQRLKTSIDAVNSNMTKLRQQIATQPPPKQKMSGNPKLKVTH
jgi:hypothetical protein